MARETRRKNDHQNARGGIKPERLGSSAVPGRSYKSQSGSGRAESAGYTTSSPGWRRESAAPKRAAAGGGGGGGGSSRKHDSGGGGHKKSAKKSGGGGGDRGPRTTSGINPPDIPQSQLGGPKGISTGGAGAFIPPAIPPSMLSPLNTPQLQGVPPQLEGPQMNPLAPPALQGVPPALDMPPINNPALQGVPPGLQSQPHSPQGNIAAALLQRLNEQQQQRPPLIQPGVASGNSPLGAANSPLGQGNPLVRNPFFGS